MRLLLDTHILLWWLADSPSLSVPARERIANPDNAVFVSSVTLWEIWLKKSLGKLEIPSNFQDKLAGQAFESLPLLATHAREVASLPWIHRDPFDRILIAQARVTQLQFLTADQILGEYGSPVVVVR